MIQLNNSVVNKYFSCKWDFLTKLETLKIKEIHKLDRSFLSCK